MALTYPRPKVVRIATLDDPRVAIFAQLTNKQLRTSARGEQSLCIAETHFVVEAALDAGMKPVALLLDEDKVDSLSELIDLCAQQGSQIYCMPVDQMSELVGFKVTRGCLAAFERPVFRSLSEVVADETITSFAVLENLTDVSNVGALIRNAAALGVGAVILAPGCADSLSRRSIRTSMGTVFKMTQVKLSSEEWPEALSVLHRAGVELYALALSDTAYCLGTPEARCRYGRATRKALLFGSEGWGLSDAAQELVDASFMIPMQRHVDSLNVAASSAIAFWEMLR